MASTTPISSFRRERVKPFIVGPEYNSYSPPAGRRRNSVRRQGTVASLGSCDGIAVIEHRRGGPDDSLPRQAGWLARTRHS